MIDTIIAIIKKVRAIINRALVSPEQYLASRKLQPLSSKYGFDRGTPVDRYYIEAFMEKHQDAIRGHAVEIVEPLYINKFGNGKVTKSDVLDIIPRRTTTIHGDLRSCPEIASDSFDCLIITQTYNVIDDYQAAIAESYRILKPGGTLLVTMPTISPAWNLEINMWRFTVDSCRYIFGKHFSQDKLAVEALGSKDAALAFWQGFALEDMKPESITKQDDQFPLIIGIKATK